MTQVHFLLVSKLVSSSYLHNNKYRKACTFVGRYSFHSMIVGSLHRKTIYQDLERGSSGGRRQQSHSPLQLIGFYASEYSFCRFAFNYQHDITHLLLKCLLVSSYQQIFAQIVLQVQTTKFYLCDWLENHLVILTLLTQNNKTQVAVSKILPLTNLAALVCLGYQSNTSQKTIYKEEEKKKQ